MIMSYQVLVYSLQSSENCRPNRSVLIDGSFVGRSPGVDVRKLLFLRQ
jgi:hypothetical protein